MPIKPLTKKELAGYVQVYREAFPNWNIEHEAVLTRSVGPISQHIAFQSLRYGAYRPECNIHVAGPPDRGSRLLHQMLDVKHQAVEPRAHDSMWRSVLQAMEEQFAPDVRRPLDIAEVLRLAEQEVEGDHRVNVRICNGLATLNVYLGRGERAVEWCDHAEVSFQEFAEATPPPDWMLKQIEFARQLCDASRQGRAGEFLAEATNQSSD